MKWDAMGWFACQALGGLLASEALREPLTPLGVGGAMVAEQGLYHTTQVVENRSTMAKW